MKNGFMSLLILLSIFCSEDSLFADSPHLYDLSGIAPIWDISGTYDEDLDGIAINLTFVQDSKGKISGGGSWSGSSDGLTVSAGMAVKGSLKQSKGITAVVIAVKHKGTVTDGMHTEKFSLSQQINAEVDNELLQMTGTMRISMSMAGRKFSDTEYWEEDLPEGMDGSCTLEIDPVNGTKGISGTAVLNLSNLEEVVFAIKGKSKNGLVQLALKGSKTTGDTGASFSLGIEAYSGELQSIKGKVLGQSIQWIAPPPIDYGSGASISVIGYYPPDPFEPTPWY